GNGLRRPARPVRPRGTRRGSCPCCASRSRTTPTTCDSSGRGAGMLFLFFVLLIICASLLAAGVIEQRRHFANLDRIQVRVLVNGIRGKSSITRLTAGALRGGGLVTVAKTTGTAA